MIYYQAAEKPTSDEVVAELKIVSDQGFSLWRIRVKDIEGRTFQLRGPNGNIASFASIPNAIKAFEKEIGLCQS